MTTSCVFRGLEPCDVADLLDVKRDTLSIAIRAGRLHKTEKKVQAALSTKSEWCGQDNTAHMGMGAQNTEASGCQYWIIRRTGCT